MDRNVEELAIYAEIRVKFAEALSHCRHASKMFTFLLTIQMGDFANKTTEQIFNDISRRVGEVSGLGRLAAYDITAAICREYSVPIEKVYLIGKGPVRASSLLGMNMKKDTSLNSNYVDIQDVIQAFDRKGYKLEDEFRTTQDGDKVESYLCVWQSSIQTMLDVTNLTNL